MKYLVVIMLFPLIVAGQHEEELIGAWKLDGVFLLKRNQFKRWEVEKHPYDTLVFRKDKSFFIESNEDQSREQKSKVTGLTIVGRWDYRKSTLYLSNRSWQDSTVKLQDLKYRLIFRGKSLYIKISDASASAKSKIYIRYEKF